MARPKNQHTGTNFDNLKEDEVELLKRKKRPEEGSDCFEELDVVIED